jgi:hypothetical protein
MGRVSHELLARIEGAIDSETQDFIEERGYRYFLEDRVETVTIEDGMVQAVVRGKRMYIVQIDVYDGRCNFFCSCPHQERCCKHVVAVAYALRDQLSRGEHDVDGHGSAAVATGLVLPFPKHTAAPAHTSAPKVRPLEVGDSWQTWRDTVAAMFDAANTLKTAKMRAREWGAILQQEWKRSQNWPPYQQRAFRLLVGHLALSYVVVSLPDSFGSEGGWHYDETGMSALMSIILRSMLEILEELERKPMKHDLLSSELADLWTNILWMNQFPVGALEVLLQLHHAVWMSQWSVLDEQAKADVLERSDVSGATFPNANEDVLDVPLALRTQCFAFLLALSGRDEEAMEWLNKLSRHHVWSYYKIAKLLRKHRQDERAVDWLALLLTNLEPKSLLGFFQIRSMFAEEWMLLLHGGRISVQRAAQILRNHLPMTRGIYSDFLMQSAQYADWVDYHLYQGTSLEYLSRDALKVLEKEQPSALFPLFHHQIADLVALRNRDAYRMAARHMKKLSGYYKKQKKMAEWHQFLSEFRSQHSRLRALQEELAKKGLAEQS